MPRSRRALKGTLLANETKNKGLHGLRMIRLGDWWIYKLSPLMALAYATVLRLELDIWVYFPPLFVVLLGMFLGASYASVINNFFDWEEDAAAGKENYFIGRSATFRFAVLGLSLASLAAYLFAFVSDPYLWLIYLLNILLFALYSVPPLRLKNRGFWGVLMMGLGESLLPKLFAVFFISKASGLDLPPAWLVAALVWALALGLRNILLHQFQDRLQDQKVALSTFLTKNEGKRVRNGVRFVLFPLEIVGLVALLLQVQSWWPWAFLLFYAWTDYMRVRHKGQSLTLLKPSHNQRVILQEFYDFFFPLAFLAAAAVVNPLNWLAFLGHALLCGQRLKWWWRDTRNLVVFHILPQYGIWLQKEP